MGTIDTYAIARDGCALHYGVDFDGLPEEHQIDIALDIGHALRKGDDRERCMMVAAIRLREIYPHVNGVRERA